MMDAGRWLMGRWEKQNWVFLICLTTTEKEYDETSMFNKWATCMNHVTFASSPGLLITGQFILKWVRYENTRKIDDLLHRGRGVQEGREVQAVQAGRGYHRYQQDQQDPVYGGERKKKGSGSREEASPRGRALKLTHLYAKRANYTDRSMKWKEIFDYLILIFLFVSLQAHFLPILMKEDAVYSPARLDCLWLTMWATKNQIWAETGTG